jgi:hypothetical protein
MSGPLKLFSLSFSSQIVMTNKLERLSLVVFSGYSYRKSKRQSLKRDMVRCSIRVGYYIIGAFKGLAGANTLAYLDNKNDSYNNISKKSFKGLSPEQVI